jgi:hypothetical protein
MGMDEIGPRQSILVEVLDDMNLVCEGLLSNLEFHIVGSSYIQSLPAGPMAGAGSSHFFGGSEMQGNGLK